MKQWTPEEIRGFRKQLGLSQAEFASLLGVTNVYISYMEGGKKRPGKTIKKLLDCMERKRKQEGV